MSTELCTHMRSTSFAEMAKCCMGTGSGGSFSERLCPALAVLVTVSSVCLFCSGGRNQAALKEGNED